MTAARSDLLATLADAAAARIHEALPGLRDCRGIAGRLDLAEIKRRGIAAPAVLVSRLGARQSQTLAGPSFLFDVDMAAFVVTKDDLNLSRDAAAQVITQALLGIVPDATWKLAGVGPAERVAELSLVSTDSEKNAIALWAVTWTQKVSLSGRPAPSDILPELYLGQAPKIGAAHEADYARIGDEGGAQP